MGLEIIPYLIKKKLNRYPAFDYSDLELVSFQKSPLQSNKPRINLLLPTINKKQIYGGISTAITFFEHIANLYEAEKRIIVIDIELDENIKRDYPNWYIISPDKDVISNKGYSLCAIPPLKRKKMHLVVRDNDFFIATSWKTKYIFKKVSIFQKQYLGVDHPVLYLIQDYEPGFYPWSSESCLAESTYKDENIIAVFNSLNLKNYFNKMNYIFRKEFFFEPILNRTMAKILINSQPQKRKNRILFYGRPFEQRNCFSLGVQAIKILIQNYKLDNSWEIVSMGAWHRDIKLNNGFVMHSVGKLSIEEYSNLLLTSRVGLSLMCSPHPSYPPLELATFGVVTVTNNYICKDLSKFNNNLITVDKLDFETLAFALYSAIQKSKENLLPDIKSSYVTESNQFNEIDLELLNIWK